MKHKKENIMYNTLKEAIIAMFEKLDKTKKVHVICQCENGFFLATSPNPEYTIISD